MAHRNVISLRLSDRLKKAVAEYSEKSGLSANKVIRLALYKFLGIEEESR